MITYKVHHTDRKGDMEDLIVPIGVPITIVCVLLVAACVVSMAFSGGLK